MVILSSGFIVIIVFWLLVYLVDTVLKKSRKYGLRYSEYLRENGLSTSAAHIRWQTSMFNRSFVQVGRLKPNFLLCWFNIGAVFGSLSMGLSVVLLSGMLYKSMNEAKPEQVLQPVMPGLNLPWNQALYYVITLIIAGAFHEIGHAIAAVRENVRVVSFGLFVLFIYPGAFVELNTDQLEISTPVRKLRIFTAGVWHNFVLAVAALLFSSGLPYILMPLYASQHGVVVTWISQKSSIVANLPVGDVVTSINHCKIRTSNDWYRCCQSIRTNPVDGYCNSEFHVKAHNTSLPALIMNFNEPDCCNDTSSYKFCFYYERSKLVNLLKKRQLNTDTTNTLVRTSGNYISKFTEHACLPARTTMSLKQQCLDNRGCTKSYIKKMLCLKPLTKNTTRVVRITHGKGQDILFVGDPLELLSYLKVSDYVPKYIFSFLHLPEHLHIMSMYLLSISSALAILNMVPCFFLDGHQTLSVILQMLFPDKPVFRSLLEPFILFFGSCLLGVNILIALYSLVADQRM